MTALLPARAIPGQSQPIQMTHLVPGRTLNKIEQPAGWLAQAGMNGLAEVDVSTVSGEPGQQPSDHSAESRTLSFSKPRGWAPAIRGWIEDRAFLLPHALLFDLALVAAILALLWTTLGMNLHQERSRAFLEAERDTSNFAGAAEQVLARTIEAVDQRILFIREAYRADRLGFSLDFLRQENGFLDGAALQVAV